MTLIEQRHPKLGELLRLWRSHCRGEKGLPSLGMLFPGKEQQLVPIAVLLMPSANDVGGLFIAASGSEVDALYGEPLAGAPVRRLAPTQGDAEQEAWSAIETGQPVLIEDDLRAGARRCRVARLYLPLANDDATSGGVLCGIITLS